MSGIKKAVINFHAQSSTILLDRKRQNAFCDENRNDRGGMHITNPSCPNRDTSPRTENVLASPGFIFGFCGGDQA